MNNVFLNKQMIKAVLNYMDYRVEEDETYLDIYDLNILMFDLEEQLVYLNIIGENDTIDNPHNRDIVESFMEEGYEDRVAKWRNK